MSPQAVFLVALGALAIAGLYTCARDTFAAKDLPEFDDVD